MARIGYVYESFNWSEAWSETGHEGLEWCRSTALLFSKHGVSRGWVVNATPCPLYTRGREPVPTVQKAGWALGPVWTGVENLAFTGIGSPHHPGSNELLYRLLFPGPLLIGVFPLIVARKRRRFGINILFVYVACMSF
jgi:hypothetical protein